MTIHYLTFVSEFQQHVNILLNNYIFDNYSALASNLKIPLALTITIYLIIFGLLLTNGFIKFEFNKFIKQAIIISFVYTIAINWDWFALNVIDLIQNGANECAAVILKASSSIIKDFASGDITQALQNNFNDIMRETKVIWGTATWRNPLPYTIGWVYTIFSLMPIIVSLFALTLAKIIFSALLISAPIFSIFLLFDSTKKIFSLWSGYIIGSSFTLLLVTIALPFTMAITHWVIYGATLRDMVNNFIFVPAVIVGLINTTILLIMIFIALKLGSKFKLKGEYEKRIAKEKE